MAIDMSRESGQRRKSTGKTSIEYQMIFLVCFLFFVFATVLERLMPWTWFKHSENRQAHRSLVGKAWDAAETCTTYAFMG